MTKIFDLVNFHTAYGDQVRLVAYFYNENNPTANVEHMRGYVPILSHREAFLELAQAQLPSVENKEKVFMLTGSYGTGKSHLCLMLANYFSLKPTEPEMHEFFDNWAKRDPAGADKVRNWRGDSRYLVAPCEFGENRPFEDMLLTAIQTALEKEGAHEIILNTHFKGALRQIEAWEQRQRAGEPIGVFEDFMAFLGGDDPHQELEVLKQNLGQFKSTAMDLFQETYEKATGQRLAFRTDSLLAILRDLLSSPEFQKRYKGLVILADEFGYALGEGRVSMSVFQGFAEMSKDGVAGMQLIFVGTGHRRFEAYGANTLLQVDFRTVQDRVTEVSLQSEELEQIIAALVSPKTESPEWQQEVLKKNNWLLSQMASNAKKFRIFDYLSEPELLNQIVKNIYPVHPLATYCLTQMSQELGSDARSVFAFFRKFGDTPPEGGYSWFVRNTDVTRSNGELNILTPEVLVLYFKPNVATTSLTVRPEIRNYIRNYLAAVDEARRYAFKHTLAKEIDPFTQRVLDLIFVYRVSGFNVTQQTMEYGLNLVQPGDKKMLTSELKSLLANKILFQSPSGEYEFRRSDMADLDTLISETRQDLLNQPLALSTQVAALADKRWEPFTEAKGHNQDYLGDKRLRRVFATPQEMTAKYKLADGSEASFWAYYEQIRLAQKSWSERYDGVMVFVLCENDIDVQSAQQAARSNNCTHITIGVPKTPIPIKMTVIDLMAVQGFMKTEAYGKLDFQEKSLVDEMLGKELQKTGRVGDFLRVRERYLEAKGLHWYREDGKTLVADPINEYEPADALMNRLFGKRNTVSHTYLSKAHPKSFSGSRDTALRDAVARLVDSDRLVQIDHAEKENRGEIRYLKLALADHGVLQQEGDYDGNIASYELEGNPAKYQPIYPALTDLIEKLKTIGRGETLNIWAVLSDMTEAPYGLGPFALSLFTACAVRHFGDELRLKINPSVLGYSPTNDPEIIIDLATGKFPTATVERRFLNPATSSMINQVYNLFAETPAPAGTQQTLSEAWRALQTWWKARTRLERAVGIYRDDSSASAFVNLLAQYSDNNLGSQILLEELKQIYGYNVDAEIDETDASEIIQQLRADKEVVETRARSIKSSLVQNLSVLFQPQGDTYQAYVTAISAWYDKLHPEQKLLTADWQSPTSRTVLEAVQKLQDIEKAFLEIVPSASAFNLGKVDDWSYDQSTSYINIFKDALKRIEDSLPKVPPPVWRTSVEPTSIYQGQPAVKYHGTVELTVFAPEEGLKVRVTKNEDPRSAKQFVTVEKSAPWEMNVVESCSYWMVAQNSQGDFSNAIRVGFTNLDEGYKLIAETAPKLEPGEREYRFRNPVDKNGLLVLLQDIIDHLKKDQRIPHDEVLAAFEQAVQAGLADDTGGRPS